MVGILPFFIVSSNGTYKLMLRQIVVQLKVLWVVYFNEVVHMQHDTINSGFKMFLTLYTTDCQDTEKNLNDSRPMINKMSR